MQSKLEGLPTILTKSGKMPAIVAWLDNNVGLEVARNLFEHQVPVIALAVNANNYRCKSRFVQHVVEVPDGDTGLVKVLQELKDILPKGAVFCPTTDALAQTFSDNRSCLEPFYKAAVAERDTLASLGDKAKVDAIAQKKGVPAPRTWVINTLSDIQFMLSTCKFPIVVKPSIRTDEWWAIVKAKVLKIETPEQLIKSLPQWLSLAPSLVIQEWIDGGDDHNYFYLTYVSKQSEFVAEVVGQKIRCWPPSTGVGSSSQQTSLPKLNDMARKLLSDSSFQGFCEIEFKRKKGTDEFFFIEANVGRPSLQSSLAESCGIELQYTMYCDCAGLPLPENTEIKHPGAKCVVWRTEVKAGINAIARGKLSVIEWMLSLRGKKRSIDLHIMDPRVVWCGFIQPVITQLPELLKNQFTRKAEAELQARYKAP